MSERFEALEHFFLREVCQKATKPLRVGTEMSVKVDENEHYTLRREKEGLKVLSTPCKTPDLSFTLTLETLKKLNAAKTEDVGEMGVELLKLLAQNDPTVKMHAKVHIGLFDLLTKGYLGVLPLGGPAVMKFLGAKGLTNMGKIKEAISRLRTDK